MHEFEFIKNKKVGIIYDIIIGTLSFIAVFIVLIQFNNDLTIREKELINSIDNITYLLFLIDGIIKLILSKNWKRFIKENKIDYIALIPFQFFIAGNFSSVFKLLRVITYFLRIIDNIKIFLKSTGILNLLIITFLITFFSSLGIYFFERGRRGINTFGDSIWFSIVTLSTVGYGDLMPKTITGKIISTFLMIAGISIFTVLVSKISYHLISLEDEREKLYKYEEDKVFIDISDLSEEKRDMLLSYYTYLKKEEKDNYN